MQHPFIGDLSNLSMDELQEKINTLNKNLIFIQRQGNYQLSQQMYMVLESYNAEYSKRMDEFYKKQNVQNPIKIEKT